MVKTRKFGTVDMLTGSFDA